MEESQFQRELSKYKVVRLEDFYRPRFKKVESKQGTLKHVTTEKKPNTDKEKCKNLDVKELSFWILLEGALADILSPSEVSTVVAKMKKGMSDVPGSINLEDLDTATAALI